LSYKELSDATHDLAARWAGRGIAPGDRVVLLLNDEAEFVLSILAAIRAGVIAVPYFPPFILSQRDAYLDGLRRICLAAGAARCLAGELVVRFLDGADLPCGVDTFADLQTAEPAAAGTPGPDDPAFIQFTSGSTGEPKGVVVTNRALVEHGRSLAAAIDIRCERDRGVSWLPLYHDMGLIGKVFVSVSTMTSTWYMSPQRFIRDPVGFLRTVSEVRGTIVFAPNFAYGLMARRATAEALAGLDLSAWRVAGCGAEPVRAGTLRRFAAAYAPAGFRASQLVPCYGLAEATLAVCSARPGDGMTTLAVDEERLSVGKQAAPVAPGAPGSVELVSSGTPLPGIQVRIVDPAGVPLRDDAEGEITVSGRHLAAGYYRNPAATAQTWREGWLYTGDTGFLHGGELYVTGRIKDLIIVNGRNYQPHDIEQAVEQVEGVRPGGAAAFGVSRDDSEAVHVLIEAGSYPPAADLVTRVAEAIRQRFSVPVDGVTVVRKGTIPKTSSGKVRRQLAARLHRDGRLAVYQPTSAPNPTEGVSR
jgi:fatty-acyl-CoA synthase